MLRAGVADPDRVLSLVAEIEEITGTHIEDVPRAASYLADPDSGVLSLLRIAEAAREAGTLDSVRALAGTQAGATFGMLVGASIALGDFLVRHPEVVADAPSWDPEAPVDASHARERLLSAVGADPSTPVPVATIVGEEGINAMRVAYRRELTAIAAVDIAARNPLAVEPAVSAALADLAAAALDAGLAIARAEQEDYADARLAIIAMGKCGARELNYVSDVDDIYVAEPADGADEAVAMAVATRLATRAAACCSASAGEPPLWQVDPNLRPVG